MESHTVTGTKGLFVAAVWVDTEILNGGDSLCNLDAQNSE
jgi:hypothetical protein